MIAILLVLSQNLINKVDPAYVCDEVKIDGCDFPPKNWEHQKFLSVMGIWGTDNVLKLPLPEGKNFSLLLTDLECCFYPETFAVQNITLSVSLSMEGSPREKILYEFFCSKQHGNETLTKKIPLGSGTVFIDAKFGAPPSLLSAIVAKGIYLVKD